MKFKLIAIIMGIMLLSGCTDASNTSRILTQNGYTDVSITGYSWFMCAESDLYSTGFTAKSPNGRYVSGAVCSGMFFKGSTIRFD